MDFRVEHPFAFEWAVMEWTSECLGQGISSTDLQNVQPLDLNQEKMVTNLPWIKRCQRFLLCKYHFLLAVPGGLQTYLDIFVIIFKPRKCTFHARTFIQILFISKQCKLHLLFQISVKRTRTHGAACHGARNTKSKEAERWHLWAAPFCLQTTLAYPETRWNSRHSYFILTNSFLLPSSQSCLGIRLSFHSWGATSSVISTEKLSMQSIKVNIYSIC